MRFLKNTVFVLWLVIGLASLSISASIWAISATMRAAALSKTVATQAIQHRKKVQRILVSARLKRSLAAIPAAGMFAAGYFEKREMDEWLKTNPGKSKADYGCEVAAITAEVIDEVLANAPVTLALPSWAKKDCTE